jgi:hypothetical protein
MAWCLIIYTQGQLFLALFSFLLENECSGTPMAPQCERQQICINKLTGSDKRRVTVIPLIRIVMVNMKQSSINPEPWDDPMTRTASVV